MAHLTKLTTYNIEDSNIALLGSDLEKHVREHAGDKESAWQDAGSTPGLQIWRIEKFHVVEWPKERAGSFYDGDSYIVLHTYKKTPESRDLSYDLHFWLGENTTQDEAGTAAYKTVELDDHLNGRPIQYREVHGFESARFLSNFPHFVCLRGGVSTGFHHVSKLPPLNIRKLYRISLSHVKNRSGLLVREVAPEASSLVEGDVFVLDKGTEVWQFNTKTSAGKEKFNAAEFVQSLVGERRGHCDITVYDEGGPGAGIFLSEFGNNVSLSGLPRRTESQAATSPKLFRLSDSTGTVILDQVEPPSFSTLSSEDAFLFDFSAHPEHPAIYVWIGKAASLNERRLAVQYAQNFLYNKHDIGEKSRAQVAITLVKMNEGEESEQFIWAIGTSL